MDTVLNKDTASFSKLGQYGRCCNAMFELSALISYCKKYNKLPQIPNWQYLKYFKNLPIPTENIVVDKTYNEPNFHYNEIPFFDRPIEIMGYFQSCKYHEGINVQELFELKPEYQKQVDDLYQQINPLGLRTVAVHIRRGDYLKPPHDEYHGVLELSYYLAGLIHLLGKNLGGGMARVLFFSDDIEWCKQHFKDETGLIYHFIEGNSDIIDLFLMAKCNDNIIANSSFSYWAYLLNQNNNKHCIAPKNWFKGAGLDTKDLYLPEMILI